MRQAALDVGVPMTRVDGTLELKGTVRDSRLAALNGSLALPALKLADRTGRDFRAEFYKPADHAALRIGKITGQLSGGEIEWTDGMLYPVLHRLEEQGCIRARWGVSDTGRKRKYYVLEAPGRVVLKDQRAQWLLVQATLGRLWGPQHA